MKTAISIIIATILFTISCKKETTTPTTTNPSSTAPQTTITVRISLVDVIGVHSIFNPKMIGIKISPTGIVGDTVFKHTISNWAQLTACPSSDNDCNSVYKSFPSDSITYTGANDGSYIRLYFYEGTTFKHACRTYYGSGNISSDSSAGNVIEHYVDSPPLITLSW